VFDGLIYGFLTMVGVANGRKNAAAASGPEKPSSYIKNSFRNVLSAPPHLSPNVDDSLLIESAWARGSSFEAVRVLDIRNGPRS